MLPNVLNVFTRWLCTSSRLRWWKGSGGWSFPLSLSHLALALTPARFVSYFGTGVFFGKIMCMVVCVDFMFLLLLAWLCPDDRIDRAPKWDAGKYEELRKAAAGDDAPSDLHPGGSLDCG
jgi:hypothetical protein